MLNNAEYFLTQHGITLNTVVLVFTIFLFLVGISSIDIPLNYSNSRNLRKSRNRIQRMFDNSQRNNNGAMFLNLNSKFDIEKYQFFRFVFIFILCVFALLSFIQNKKISSWIIFILFIVYITHPQDVLFGRKTPFKWFIEKIKINNLRKRDEELSGIITQLKNLIIAQQDDPWSADYTIETLTRFSNLTKPIFTQTLRLHREGRLKESCEYFEQATGTRLGREFASVLYKLDELNPAEFLHQLTNFQSDIKEKKQTERLKKQKTLSSFLFLITMIVCCLILMDGMYIVIFHDAMQQMELL